MVHLSYIKLEKVEPTVFFLRDRDELKQLLELTILNDGKETEVDLEVETKFEEYHVKLGSIGTGTQKTEAIIPDIQQPTDVTFRLYVGKELQDELPTVWKPKRHWLLYLVQESHHDIGYTDLPQNVFEEQNGFIDKAMEFCDATADWSEESKFRYNIEQSCSLVNYVESRPAETVEKLMRLVKEGRIEVPALYGNLITDMCGHEELIRALYPSFALKRKYGIQVGAAEIDDIPGFSWSLASILAGSRVKYFAPALPRGYYRGNWAREKPREVHPFWDEDKIVPHGIARALHWIGPDDNRVILWYGPGYGISHGFPHFLGDYEYIRDIIPKMLNELEEKGYPFDALRFRVEGGDRDNAPPSLKYSQAAKEWNSKWAYPKIIIATNTKFFEYLEKQSGKMPEIRGELPNTDYTVGATSTARETGISRVAHDLLLSAEKFSTIAATFTDYPYPHRSVTKAYSHMLLYDEHTWGMAHPLGPAQDADWAEKALDAYKAAALAHDSLVKSVNKIVDQVNLPEKGYHIVVFNPLCRKRTDVVYAFLREPDPCGRPMYLLTKVPNELKGKSDRKIPILTPGTALGRNIVAPPASLFEEPFDIVDQTTGQKTPYQIVEVASPQDTTPMAAGRYALGGLDRRNRKAVVFAAEDLPPLGYKTYRIVPSERATTFATSIKVTGTTLESRFYKIVVDPKTGAIESIYDKELKKELVDSGAPHGFNQFIARSSVDGKENPAMESNVERGKNGSVMGSLIIRGKGEGCPQRTQEIAVFDKIKRIDIANRLLKDSTPFQEIYFAFPFKVDEPRFKFEATNSVITPTVDQIPGSCTDYYATQHWVNVSNQDLGITFSSIDAHMVEFGEIRPGYVSFAHHCVTPPEFEHEFLKPGDLRKGYVYSYVMNNNFRTNFSPTQVGDMLFRYSMTSHTGNWKQGGSRDFGWEASNPPVPVFAEGNKQGSLKDSQSFCSVDKPSVMLLNMKMAEDNDGIIIRLIETEGKEASATVTFPSMRISEAYLTNLVEENERKLDHGTDAVTVPIKAFGIATARIRLARKGASRERAGRGTPPQAV